MSATLQEVLGAVPLVDFLRVLERQIVANHVLVMSAGDPPVTPKCVASDERAAYEGVP